MHEHVVLRVVTKLLVPFILLFGMYILMHGKYSPGGGFQAGVILAVAFIAYGLVFSARTAMHVVSLDLLRWLAALGLLVIAVLGGASAFMGGQIFDYNQLLEHPQSGQFWGIMVMELAIGLTVTCVMISMYYLFATYPLDDEPVRKKRGVKK